MNNGPRGLLRLSTGGACSIFPQRAEDASHRPIQ